jgi:hypothetical protein
MQALPSSASNNELVDGLPEPAPFSQTIAAWSDGIIGRRKGSIALNL